ncbi:MAG: SDR family NAD(P)-dependent oxidoreductase [Candidatus Koribacter versatilis]|uniref:SDR family NAD(P)-dependent oxidoreductase n=1 Tax=Candidatus Korobacter versatilis TaxID=658062 RepID=A0A932EPP5_9BACT|nr:SDR family NAD(P)-dependent oxidoreductase [Candidatus Koribacter versatilis]
MRLFEIGVLPPAGSDGSMVLLAAGRAGELPFLDATAQTAADLRPAFELLSAVLGIRLGLRVDASSVVAALASLPAASRFELALISGADDIAAAVALLRARAQRVFCEVTSVREAEAAVAAGADGVVAKGNESGGRIGTETTFVLLQHLLARFELPTWAQGGIGPNGAAACIAAGATGIILCDQLALAPESDLAPAISAQITAMDGTETVAIGEALGCAFRVHRMRNAATVKRLQEVAATSCAAEFKRAVADALAGQEPPLVVGQDAAFAARLAEEHGDVAGILLAYRQRVADNLKLAAAAKPFAEGAPLAQTLGTRCPVVQGPMTRVSDVSAFADAVSRGGALPFLALALLREADVERLLRETAVLLAERPWGVGILAFVPAELRQEQLRAVLKLRPKFALLAGGRPDQAQALEANGIATFIHAPSARLLEMFLRDGSRRFVFEGRECGGHVGPLSSLVLWESVLQALIEHQRATGAKQSIEVLFAGGIHDARSAAMVAALAAPAAALNVQLGVLMGTAYLFTREAVTTGAIVPGFQEEAVACGETVLLDAEGGHAIRCAPSAYAEEFKALKNTLLRSRVPAEEARKKLEEVNVGRLRMASKGLTRESSASPKLVEVDRERQKQEGMYMMGQVAALRHDLCTIDDLHADVCAGSTARLTAIAERMQPARAQVTNNQEPIAVVGLSCILPGSPQVEDLWQTIVSLRDTVTEVPAKRFSTRTFYDPNPAAPDRIVSKWGGFIEPVAFDPLDYGIPPASLQSVEPMHLLMLECVKDLFEASGYRGRPLPRERTGIVIGTGGASWDLSMAYQTRIAVEHFLEQAGDVEAGARDQVLRGLRRLLPAMTEDSFPGILGNVMAGRIANRFDLGGPNYTVDAACAASLGALDTAMHELRSGATDVMIAGGAEGAQNIYTFLLFSKTHALSAKGKCRPFDAAADGIAISEGVASVLLKRLSDAERDGDRIYGVIRGIGAASDGRDKSLTCPSVNGQRRAVERAYENAGVSPATVSLVEAHGTGTVVGDRTELETLRTVFEAAGALPQTCALGSLKSQIGHTKNVAGVAGLIKAILGLHYSTLPPTLVGEPLPAVRNRALPFYLNTRPRPWLRNAEHPRRAGVSAFGFGGTNFHTVLEEAPAQGRASARRNVELFAFRAAKREDLAQKVEQLGAKLAAAPDATLAEIAAALDREAVRATGEHRLAIVAATEPELKQRVAAAVEALRAGKALPPSGPIGYGEGALPGSIAFLFPGQGSQYLNMLAPLAMAFPAVREHVENADRALRGVLPSSLASAIYPPPAYSDAEEQEQRATLRQTWYAQPALGVAGHAMHSLLHEFGLEPAMVAGHSYGEYVALCAAGVFGYEQLIRLSEVRGRLVQSTQGRDAVAMVAVQASEAGLRPLLAQAAGVSLAGINAPKQTIIGGATDAVTTFLPQLDAAGIGYTRLAMNAGFHIAEARPAAARLQAELEQVALAAPRLPVYSNFSAGAYSADASAMRGLLVEQLTRPVRFQQEIEAMYAAGARVFVEAGPGRVLSGLVRQILSDPNVVVVATNGGADSDAYADLVTALARLYVIGANVRLERLAAGRDVRLRKLDTLLRPALPLPATTWMIDGGSAHPLHVPARKPQASLVTNEPMVYKNDARNIPLAVPAPAPATAFAPSATPASAPLVSGAPPAPTGDATLDMMAAFQATMRSFLDYQARAQQQRTELMTRFLETQRAVFEAIATGSAAPNARPAAVPPVPSLPSVVGAAASAMPVATKVAPGAAPAAAPATVSAAPAPRSAAPLDIQEVLLTLVSERTGYPVEMLDLDYNMEADLGIDSIKRTEIFGGLRETLDLKGDAYEKEEYFLSIARLRTLREVLGWLDQQLADCANAAPAAHAAAAIAPQAAVLESPAVTQPPQAEDGPVRRYVLRAVAAAASGEKRAIPDEQVIILTEDDQGHVLELASAARALGRTVAVVRHAKKFRTLGPGHYEADLLSRDSVKELRESIARHHGPVTAICHLLPLSCAKLATEEQCLEVKSLFLLASAFARDLRAAKGTLIAVTGMGGSFGVEQMPADVRAGQMSIPGFLKSIAHEWPEVFIKSVDVNANDGALLLPHLLAAVESADRTVEVGYTAAGRSILELAASDIARTGKPGVELDAKSVVLITGGARGITAAVAQEFAARYRCTLVLAGRTPEPQEEDAETRDVTSAAELKRILAERRKRRGEPVTPASLETQYRALIHAREIRGTLEHIRQTGARCEYHSLDVRDTLALERLVAATYQRFGKIDGVVHGAGIVEDTMLVTKSMDSFDRVFDTKVQPALALVRSLRPDSLRFLVFFSSLAARTGYAGGCDYSAANEALNKLARKLDRAWPARVVAIGWGPWAEVGIAARYPDQLLSERGLAYFSTRTGCERFFEELLYGPKGEAEVVIYAAKRDAKQISGGALGLAKAAHGSA